MSSRGKKMVYETALEYTERDRRNWSRMLRVGCWLNAFLAPILEDRRLQRIANGEQARAVGGRLSSKQIQEVGNYLAQVKDLELRRDYFTSRSIDGTLSGLVVPLVENVLACDSAMRSVLNIGAYYAFTDFALATRYPHIQFTAVDLLPDMEVYNAEFAAPNLHFISCYPLERLESDEVRADITLFSATAAEIMNAELRRYFRVLSERTAYVVLSEPVYPLPNGLIINPATVDYTCSIPAYAQPDYLPHPIGPVAYIHNYRQMLIESGFEILHYQAFRPPITNLAWVLCIAKTKRSPLDKVNCAND